MNLGLVSLGLAARVGPAGAVHSFEPSPRLGRYLAETLSANPQLKITHHPVALGRLQTVLPLHIPDGNAGAATLQSDGQKSAKESIDVPVFPLTEYSEKIGIERLDFIKIDVEGFESDVIAGGMRVIEKLKPSVIVLEEREHFSMNRIPDSLKLLRDLEYRIFALPKKMFKLKLLDISNRKAADSHDYVAVSKKYNALDKYISD